MQAAQQSVVEQMRGQVANLLVAHATGTSPDMVRLAEWPMLDSLNDLPRRKDILAFVRRPHPRGTERYRIGAGFRQVVGQTESPWQARQARFRTVSQARPPLRGPRYAWCYRKYSPR